MSSRAANSSPRTPQERFGAVLEWCRGVTAKYAGVEVSNWSCSWNDGLAFCALMHAHYPDAIGRFDALSASDEAGRRKNFELAFRVATQRVGVPALLDVDDMVALYPRPDDKSILVYLSLLHQMQASPLIPAGAKGVKE